MGAFHSYTAAIAWTGADQGATTSYTSYSRDHTVSIPGKPDILGSSDPVFRGDPSRHNPEELLVASIAQCHLLWFLHMAAQAGVVVLEYSDTPVGTMRVEAAGAGQFTEVELRPRVVVAEGPQGDSGISVATLHSRAHDHCFIARSVNFPVRVNPVVPAKVD